MLVDVLEQLERANRLAPGAIPIGDGGDHAGIIAPDGRFALPALIAAGRGRCAGAHFGIRLHRGPDYRAIPDAAASCVRLRTASVW
jgi:hypothetical protein